MPSFRLGTGGECQERQTEPEEVRLEFQGLNARSSVSTTHLPCYSPLVPGLSHAFGSAHVDDPRIVLILTVVTWDSSPAEICWEFMETGQVGPGKFDGKRSQAVNQNVNSVNVGIENPQEVAMPAAQIGLDTWGAQRNQIHLHPICQHSFNKPMR